ncbi:hypothetical protein, partial [Amycolatopsis suaedae]|uniref:hypothetical protein n=1 Tax=Amycolatopsis suaedae TaxID=2510978 RepID=UPI00196B6F6A
RTPTHQHKINNYHLDPPTNHIGGSRKKGSKAPSLPYGCGWWGCRGLRCQRDTWDRVNAEFLSPDVMKVAFTYLTRTRHAGTPATPAPASTPTPPVATNETTPPHLAAGNGTVLARDATRPSLPTTLPGP